MGRAREWAGMLSLILLFTACQQKTFNSKEELMAYVQGADNGLVQQRSVNGVDFTLTYRPTDLLVAQEAIEDATKEQIDSLRKKYHEYLYFNVTLAKNQQEVLTGLAGNRNEFGTMVNQLAFGMGEKVHLFSKTKDTVELADYVYPRLYGMGGGTNMLFVYPRNKKLLEEDFFHITIEDIGLNTGEVGFKIPTKAIKEEPSISFL